MIHLIILTIQAKAKYLRLEVTFKNILEQGKNNLQRLELQYFSSPIKDIFLRLDLGIMEEMFAGYGGEILYRPFDKSYHLGLSLHRVRQRDFDQRLSLRDYETTTGFVSHYLSLPYGINSKISIGKYLAGDKGITLDLSRRFHSGFTLGVFATKTNLSAEEFGEGSLIKDSTYLFQPRLFYSNFTSGNISFGLQPLTKDGGAMLIQQNALFGILGDSNRNSLLRDWDFLTSNMKKILQISIIVILSSCSSIDFTKIAPGYVGAYEAIKVLLNGYKNDNITPELIKNIPFTLR